MTEIFLQIFGKLNAIMNLLLSQIYSLMSSDWWESQETAFIQIFSINGIIKFIKANYLFLEVHSSKIKYKECVGTYIIDPIMLKRHFKLVFKYYFFWKRSQIQEMHFLDGK